MIGTATATVTWIAIGIATEVVTEVVNVAAELVIPAVTQQKSAAEDL